MKKETIKSSCYIPLFQWRESYLQYENIKCPNPNVLITKIYFSLTSEFCRQGALFNTYFQGHK